MGERRGKVWKDEIIWRRMEEFLKMVIIIIIHFIYIALFKTLKALHRNNNKTA